MGKLLIILGSYKNSSSGHKAIFPRLTTDLLDHFVESVALVFPELLVVLHASHVELVLSLWLGGLKRTGENGNIHVLKKKNYRA